MLLAQLGRVPLAAVAFDRAPDAVVDLDAERCEQRLEAGHGVAGEILVADERPVRVAIPEACRRCGRSTARAGSPGRSRRARARRSRGSRPRTAPGGRAEAAAGRGSARSRASSRAA